MSHTFWKVSPDVWSQLFCINKTNFRKWKKIKIVSLLKISEINLEDFILDEEPDECEEKVEKFIFDKANCQNVDLEEEEVQVIYYVAGYCAKKAKKIHCPSCQSLFISQNTMPSVNEKSKFFDIVNRGKLTAPSDQLFTVCCICYEFFCQLKSCPTFLHFVNLPNPASYFRDSILNKLKDLPVSCYIFMIATMWLLV